MKKWVLFFLVISLIITSVFAQEVIKELNYPANCITTQDKMEFCYIAQEKLRLEHNQKGKDFKESKITKQEWENYLKVFKTKQQIIVQNLLTQKEEMKKSTRYEVDLNALEKK